MHSSTKIRRARILLGVALAGAVGVAVGVTMLLPDGTWETWVNAVPPLVLLLALAVLPVVGFPISALHIAAGARFGLGMGMTAVAVSTVFHLLAAFMMARWLDRPIRRLLGSLGWSLPPVKGSLAWMFSLWVALLPGVSYAIKNVIAPLATVPLRIYFLTSLPVHVATALIGVGIGQSTMQFSWWRAGAIALYVVALGTLTRACARRLREAQASAAPPGASPVQT